MKRPGFLQKEKNATVVTRLFVRRGKNGMGSRTVEEYTFKKKVEAEVKKWNRDKKMELIENKEKM